MKNEANLQLPPVKLKPPEKFDNERAVKAEVKKILSQYRHYLFTKHRIKIFDFMPVSNGMGKHGIPDFNICVFGLWVSIETKFGSNEPTARQKHCLSEIRQSGGIAVVINEENLDLLISIFTQLYEQYVSGKLQKISVSGACHPL